MIGVNAVHPSAEPAGVPELQARQSEFGFGKNLPVVEA
jgi:hypothetical protein